MQARELYFLVGDVRRDHRLSELPPSLATNRPGLFRLACLAWLAWLVIPSASRPPDTGNTVRLEAPTEGLMIKGTPRYCSREGLVETSWRLWAADR